jgi:glycosyltransferase involved in cell wall biosynthesis
MSKLALVRDVHLNVSDIGNYYGLTKLGTDLILCGRGDRVPWGEIARTYPLAKLCKYDEPWEVFHHDPDVIDVPDPFYDFSKFFVNRFEKTIVVNWENLPGKVTADREALEILQKCWKVVNRSTLAQDTSILMHSVSPDKNKVISGAVDTELFKPIDHNDEMIVLFVGRLTQEKGLLDVIWACSLIDDAQLVVVGHGNRTLYQDLAEAHLPGRYKFVGQINDRTIMAYQYQQATIFCVPTLPLLNDADPFGQWSEQLGQVYLEAMACGLPIVHYSSPAVDEVVGMTGMAPRDYRSLGGRMGLYLHGLKTRQEESERLRERARTKFSQEVIAKEIKEWYEL